MAFAAAIFISSLMSLARTSNAPRKIPGKANTLLIWFGKSLRPVPMTFAPAAFAISGMISGTGLAQAKMIGSRFMDLTIASSTMPGTDTPRKMSAPTRASFRPPLTILGLVSGAYSCSSEFRPSLPA